MLGDPATIAAIEADAREMEGRRGVGPPGGPYTLHNHLSDPLSAHVLITRQFVPWTTEQTGEKPYRPELTHGIGAPIDERG